MGLIFSRRVGQSWWSYRMFFSLPHYFSSPPLLCSPLLSHFVSSSSHLSHIFLFINSRPLCLSSWAGDSRSLALSSSVSISLAPFILSNSVGCLRNTVEEDYELLNMAGLEGGRETHSPLSLSLSVSLCISLALCICICISLSLSLSLLSLEFTSKITSNERRKVVLKR